MVLQNRWSHSRRNMQVFQGFLLKTPQRNYFHNRTKHCKGALGLREEELREVLPGKRQQTNLVVVRQIFSLGGWGSAGLFVTADGDAAVAASVFGPPAGLWPGQGQQSIGRQGAGDGRLVHSGGEAVAAVKLPGDVAMVILEKQRSSSKQKNFLFWNKLRAYVDL